MEMVASEYIEVFVSEGVTSALRPLALSACLEHADAKGPHPCSACSTGSKHSIPVRAARVDLPGPPDNAAVAHRVGREKQYVPAGDALRLGSTA